jgi:geranylgeranyl diphosphate synthase, type I
MDLAAWSANTLPAVESALKTAIDENISPAYPELRAMLAYHMGWEGENAGAEARGKRIRPLLALLSCAAAGGAWQNALPSACAVELIHNFSLLHDDIQDQSRLRRGRETVWVKWGVAQAINAGDTLFALAFASLNGLDSTSTPRLRLLAERVLHATCIELTEGQYLDISYEGRADLRLNDYWPMISGKTSALLGASTELGALAANAPAVLRGKFRTFGRSLGLAFQVQDDWLGLWGDAALTGKSTASDLVAAKKTLPVLYGLEQRGAFAKRWAAGSISADEAPAVAALLDQEGAQAYTLQAAERLTRGALEALSVAGQEPEATGALRQLAETLLNRQV